VIPLISALGIGIAMMLSQPILSPPHLGLTQSR
jgi:hypothetical protein